MLVAKKWALKYAVNAACTILRVRNTPRSLGFLKLMLAMSLRLIRSSWQSVPEVQSLETRAEEWTRTTIKSPTNPQARNFYTPLCICEKFEYVFVERTKYVFECHCFDEAWLIHDLDLEVSLQYPVLISITHSQTVKMPKLQGGCRNAEIKLTINITTIKELSLHRCEF